MAGADEPDETQVVKLEPRRGAEPVREQLSPGAIAGSYEICRVIAAGGCGTVYVGEHRVLGRRVALKVLHRHLAGQPQFELRFVQEARAVNRIRHPNIVDIHEFGKLDDGRPFYVMELVDGTGLDAHLMARGALAPREALALLEPICDALQAAHDAGVIHRDVKASNVILVGQQVKLVDFGIAKLVDPEPGYRGLTVVGQRLGTPHYMAPEQIRGEHTDARVDVYALGVLLFRMLVARLPFEARDPADLERMHLEIPPPPPSRFAPVPAAVDAVVLRAMDKDPAQRFPSVAALCAALRAAVAAPAADVAASTPAVGIHVEARLADPAGELDDALVLEMSDALGLAADSLRAAGLQIAIETATSVLAARELAGTAAADMVLLVRRVHDAVAARPHADPRIRVDVCAHADAMRDAGGGELAGPLVEIAAWAPEQAVAGPCVTEELAQLVGGLAGSARDGRYVLVG